jgi:glycosyltransferase involved in cell wall biosynthesis
MARPPLSVTILSHNEEANIARAIQSVRWADEVLVVDSGSTDKTLEIARSLGAKVLSNPWPGYGAQKNFAQKAASYEWILNIDADEEVPSDLAEEIRAALANTTSELQGVHGFTFPRKTFYLGQWIQHGGWYPNYLTRLSHRKHARWTEPQVHERLIVEGKIERLSSALHHYSFPNIQSQVLTNLKFSQLGSEDLKRAGAQGSLLKLIFKPIGKFLETYLLKRGFMDGLAGFIISVNAAHSIFLKYAYLLEARVSRENPDHR